jgi:hypothetical protein
MSRWIRPVVLCACALGAVLLTSSPATAQVRVGVFVGAPVVAAPVVVAPRVVAPVAPVVPYPYAYAYSPYYYPYAYPYYGGFGFNVAFGGGYRYGYAARPYGYRGGYAYRGAVVRRHR